MILSLSLYSVKECIHLQQSQQNWNVHLLCCISHDMHQIKQKQQWQGSLQAVYMKAVTNNIHALTCSHTCSALSMVSSCKNLTSGAIRRFMLVAICFLTYPCSFLSPEIAIVLPSSSLNIDKYTLAMVRSPDTLTSVTLAIADTAESMPIRFSGQTAFCNTCNTHAV